MMTATEFVIVDHLRKRGVRTRWAECRFHDDSTCGGSVKVRVCIAEDNTLRSFSIPVNFTYGARDLEIRKVRALLAVELDKIIARYYVPDYQI